MQADVADDLLGEIVPGIEHSQYDTLDIEARIDRLPHLIHRLQQLAQAFKRKKLALQWHENRMRRRHRIHRQEIEGGRAVYQHIGIGEGIHRSQSLSKPEDAVRFLGNFHFDAEQIHGRRHDGKIRHRRILCNLADGMGPHHQLIGRQMPGTTLDPEPGAGIALRIEIDDQHPFADGGERRRKIDGRRRFTDAALLIGNSDNPILWAKHVSLAYHFVRRERFAISSTTESGSTTLACFIRSN